MTIQHYKTKDILTNAAQLIEESGWCRGQNKKTIGNKTHYCLVGAIAHCSEDHFGLLGAYVCIKRYLRIEDVVKWNDQKHQKKSRVISVLKNAAAALQ